MDTDTEAESASEVEPRLAERRARERAEEWLSDLESLVAFLREHPDLTPPSALHLYRHGGYDPGEFARVALQLGTAEKSSDETWFNVSRKFGQHVLEVYTARDSVCERVVTKTETVTEMVPDPDYVATAPMVEVERTIEEVEWVCPPSLHDLAEKA